MALHARRLDVASSHPARRDSEERFQHWLSPRAAKIDATLQRFFSTRQEGTEPELKEPLATLAEFTLRGGKRLRGALVLLGYELAAGTEAGEEALQASLAMELLQSSLLIHDDLTVGDEVRRHGPALHQLLAAANAHSVGLLSQGTARAIAVSRLAQLCAMEVIAAAPFASERRFAALEDLLAMERALWGGEWRDLSLDPRDVSIEEILRFYEFTAGRFTTGGPLRMGARLGGASQALLQAIETYARPIGVVFQIRDDLLRTFGDARETGVSSGSLLRTARPRLLVVEALQRGKAADVDRLHELLGQASRSEREVSEVRDLIIASGAREAALARAEALLAEAKSALSSFPEPIRPLLGDLADFTLDRHR
jgi:geranylgeranyl diphosphate synthase type I